MNRIKEALIEAGISQTELAKRLGKGFNMDTEIGKIAALMNATKEKKTPLQVSLDQFGSRLAMAIMENVDNAVVSFVGARFARPKTVCFVSPGRQTLPLQLTIG